MSRIDTLIQKEANITDAWQKEFLRIVTIHIKKNGWTGIEDLNKVIAEKIPKYAKESLQEGVTWLNDTLTLKD